MTHHLRRLRGVARSPRTGAVLVGLALAAMPAVVGAQEEESGGIAALGFSLPGLVAQLINFTILLVLLRLFLWNPILRLLDERKKRIEEGLARSEQAATAAQASEEEARRAIEQARAEGREMVQRSQETAARLREELEAQARAEASQLVARAREEIALERQQAIQQLRSEFADLTIIAAERVVGQSLDRPAHQRLIDEVLVSSDFGADGATRN
ncbi:MAG: F0F1 ATP synthase subunit B [Dehalococcoidia bacterium]|nr:F0F1 ATP synthase subunit B [Dehalococcoidia bacterium]